jgi:hypothetical protein
MVRRLSRAAPFCVASSDLVPCESKVAIEGRLSRLGRATTVTASLSGCRFSLSSGEHRSVQDLRSSEYFYARLW